MGPFGFFSRTEKRLGIAALSLWLGAGLIWGVAILAPTPSRGIAQTADTTPEPSTRRDYCGLPAREDAACPFTPNTRQPPSALALLEDLESRARIRVAASTRHDAETRRRESAFSQSFVQQLSQRTRHLQAYWQNFGTPISTATFDAGVLAHSLPPLPELYGEYRDTALSVMDMVLRDSLQLADSVIRRERELPALSEAAALWWSARFFQIQLSCPNETTPTESPFRQWAEQQSELQSCRRQYLREATARIDAALLATHAERLRLNSREWNLIWMLGSRRERGQALLSILPRLHLNEGAAPPDLAVAEIYFLGRHLLQVVHERTERQALTWNGYVNAEPDDLLLFDREIEALQRTFVSLIATTQNLRERAPAFYRAVRRTWSAVYGTRTPESWNRLGWDDESANPLPMGTGWIQECNEGVDAACALWLQKHAVGSADAWEALILGNDETRQTGANAGIRLRSWLSLLPAYATERTAALRQRGQRTAWSQLHRRIQDRLQTAYRLTTSLPALEATQMSQCISATEWLRWAGAELPISGPEQLSLRAACPNPDPARDWLFPALVMRQLHSNATGNWQDNPAALIARYAAWLRWSEPHPVSHRVPYETTRPARAYMDRYRAVFAMPARRTSAEVMMDQFNEESSPWLPSGAFSPLRELESFDRATRVFSIETPSGIDADTLNDLLL